MSADASATDLTPEAMQRLLAAAREARARAYAPYSRFPVGAALLAEDGRVFAGCNVENASFGLTTCAERVAIGKAVSEGVHRFRAVAVVGPEGGGGCPPCGSCRQILHEFEPGMAVILETDDAPLVTSVDALLPGAFVPAKLERGNGA